MKRTNEQIIIYYLKKVFKGIVYIREGEDLTNEKMIGYILSYYLTEILQQIGDSNIKDKWLDDVSWKDFKTISQNKVEGKGDLWWGFNEDASLFPDKFYCEIEVKSLSRKKYLDYFFVFSIDEKIYNLKRNDEEL